MVGGWGSLVEVLVLQLNHVLLTLLGLLGGVVSAIASDGSSWIS